MRQLTITKSITNRESESVNRYLTEISKVDMVTAEEEIKLAQKIKLGDQAALDILTKANLRFVVSVAKQYQFRGLSLSDLINEGNLGLIKAAKRFDETKGFKFISYAVWWIRQSIIQALTEQSRLVRLPGNRVNTGMRVQKAFNQLEQEHERAPSAEELADVLNMTAEEVTATTGFDFYHFSLDAPIGESNDGSMADFLKDDVSAKPDTGVAYTQSLKQELERCLKTLDARQKEIVCSFYGIGEAPLTQQEIANKYELTGERIRQIKDKALKLLRTTNKKNLLQGFLGGV